MQQLTDLLLAIKEKLIFFEIINHYDRGVRLRFGKAIIDKTTNTPKILEPGFYWKWPFGIDDILTHMIKPTTMDLHEQTVTTKDGKSVVVRGVLKYEVSDVAILLLEVDSPQDAVADLSMGFIRDTFVETDWADCNNPDLPNKIAIKIRREAKKWGIDIKSLTLTDLGMVPSIRLITK